MNLSEKKYLDLIVRHLTGEIDQSDSQHLQEWTDASPEHLTIRKEIEAIWNQAGHWSPPSEISADAAWAEFRRRVDLPARKHRPYALSPLSRTLLRAAAAITLLACALWWLLPQRASGEWLLVEANDGHEQLSLPDGSEIWLRKGSALRYPRQFDARSRDVRLLRGEAYFEVAPRPEHPFVVRTPREGERVEVLGTSFQVSCLDKRTHVLVRTGRVRFSAPDMPRSLELVAGQRAALLHDHPQSPLQTRVENFNELAWRLGALEFQQTPLQQVLVVLSDYLDTEIRLDNPALAQCPCSMRMTHPDITRVLDNLKEIYGLSAKPLDSGKGYALTGGNCPK
ncbi:MAG: FecR family protein [Saprospiraceae bacterium]